MRVWPLLLLLAGCGQTDSFAFQNVSVMFPAETAAFPERPGAEAMTANCAGCHSPSMVLTQPRLTADQWKAEVDKMKTAYRAPVDPAAESAILKYLTATSEALPR
ncbi:MAG: cytochrome c [Sphingomonadaceae bacterium]|nr:cytochrome c [Sphingomonadaceae bacterium]